MTLTMRPESVTAVTKSGFRVEEHGDAVAAFFYFPNESAATNFTNSFVAEVLGGENDAMREALVESVAAYLNERDLAARDDCE